MNLQNKNNQNNSKHHLLSATFPLEKNLKSNTENKTVLQTRLRQKKIIKIYIEDNKNYIEHSVAYALKLINTRAIMLDKPKMIVLPDSIHNKLKKQDDIVIEYIKVEKKQKLKVYVDNLKLYIDNATAFTLGWISVEQFYAFDNKYYYIDKESLDKLKEKFEIEFYSLTLQEEMHKKR